MAVGPFILFVLDLLSAAVAFVTSYYAYRTDRLADSPLLKAIAFGFMLLGVGLLTEAGTSVALGQTLAEAHISKLLGVIATVAYLSTQMVAYAVFAAGYGLLAFGRSKAAMVPAVAVVGARIIDFAGLYRFAVLSYFVVLVLLAYIVFQGVLIHSKARSRFSLLVLLAFTLVMASHAILLASVIALSGGLFLIGASVQFFGFLSLLVFLLRSGRVGAG